MSYMFSLADGDERVRPGLRYTCPVRVTTDTVEIGGYRTCSVEVFGVR